MCSSSRYSPSTKRALGSVPYVSNPSEAYSPTARVLRVTTWSSTCSSPGSALASSIAMVSSARPTPFPCSSDGTYIPQILPLCRVFSLVSW